MAKNFDTVFEEGKVEDTVEKKGFIEKASEFAAAHPIVTKVGIMVGAIGIGAIAVKTGKKFIDGKKAIDTIDTVKDVVVEATL